MSEPTPTPSRTQTSTSKVAYALLGAMTLISFVGPFGLALLLSGGDRKGWPPDRAVEWAGAIGLFVAFAACFVACLTVGLWLIRPAPTVGDDPPPQP